jgi:hypothetical protein
MAVPPSSKDDLSSADRVRIFDLLFETANKEPEKGIENKQFLARLANTAARTVGIPYAAMVLRAAKSGSNKGQGKTVPQRKMD